MFKVVKSCFLEIKKRGLEDYIEKLETELNILNSGEIRLNQGCIDERENLMAFFQNKKALFEDFQKSTNIMEEKIGIHEDLTRKLSEINEKLISKEKYLSNEGDELRNLKKKKFDLKVRNIKFLTN